MEFDLTTDQIKSFDNDGYIILRKWIPTEFLSLLCQASSEAINNGLRNFQLANTSGYIATITNSKKQFVTRVNDLFIVGDPIFLQLLGCPQIVNVATALCGNDRISTYESLLVKNKGDDQAIGWHRDMGHDRHDRVITLGVYLDATRKNKGGLRIIPKSQSSSKDVCTLVNEWDQGCLEIAEIEMDPGDVLVHDVMVLHSSEPITKQKYRRTIYFEFRSQTQAQTNPGFTREWIELRHQLLELAQRRWRKHHYQTFGNDEWSKEERQLMDKLYAVNTQIEPGHYCFPHR